MESMAYEGGNAIGGGDPGRDRMASDNVVALRSFCNTETVSLKGSNME